MTNKPVVLAIDDVKENLEILLNILNDDFDVIPTLSGESALKILEVEYVDIILLDIVMPKMNGFEVCLKIKNNPKLKNIPILFLTAKTKIEDIKKGFSLGAIDYITKPFNHTELLIRIKNYLELFEYRFQLEKKIQEEIIKTQEAQKLMTHNSKLAEMGTLLNMIAHQWRQPLGAIRSIMINIDFTLKSGKFNFSNKKDQNSFLDFLTKKHIKVNENIEFLSNTIDNFSDFYKTTKEKEFEYISIPIEETLNIIEISLKNNGIDIIVNLDSKVKIFMNKNELMQVILSILKNSEDNFLFNKVDNPRISISIKNEFQYVIIKICDNGGGINENIINDIFNPYFSTKLDKNGTGLGLYMSKLIIEKHHNGKLNVYNTNDGVCFDIRLDIKND